MRCLLIALVCVVVAVPLAVGGGYAFQQWRDAQEQAPLDAFYTPPDPVVGRPGTILRSEPAPDWDITGATATRILYVTQGVDGVARVAGGMVWVPTEPPPRDGERPVVAWAHGTVGLGDECAPSRSPSLMPTMATWLQLMVARGWVVTATDYQGLGTPPPYSYLVGRAEAADVINSVRAARDLPGSGAGDRWAAYGFSQGGHAVLWAALTERELAPDLRLTAVAAVSPAAPLPAILDQQWDTGVAWAIGPEVMVSWPSWDDSLDPAAVVGDIGQRTTTSQALDCATTGALIGLGRQALGQRYFAENPLQDPTWAAALVEETPRPLPASMPLLVPIGTQDNVVLPTSIAAMQRQWCRAGSDLTMDWLGGVDHLSANSVAAPNVVDWLADRFAGRPTQRNCAQAPPVAPYRPTQ